MLPSSLLASKYAILLRIPVEVGHWFRLKWGSIPLRCGAGFRWEVGHFSDGSGIVPHIGRNRTREWRW